MPKSERTAAILVAAGRGLRAGVGRAEAIPLDRRADRDFPGDGAVLPSSTDFCRAAGPAIPMTRRCSTRPSARCAMRRPPMAGPRARPRCMPDLKRSPADKPDIVLIHDAARPFVTAALISRAIDAAGRTGAAVPAIAVTDTIKLIDADRQRRGNAGACAAANRANAAGVPVRRHSRCPSPRRARGPRRFHRRRGICRMGGIDGGDL